MTLHQMKIISDIINKTLIYLILSLFGLSMIFPFLWMLSTSLKDPTLIFTSSINLWPSPIIWRNYLEAWNAIPFGRFYVNSTIVAIAVTAGQVVTSSMAAYAFSRLRFPGRDKIFFAYLATMMIPGMVTLIPVFILLKTLNWLDTYKALILPGIFSAYGTFMLRQFFMTLPADLEDAAKIDGCSLWRIYWQIILPLSKPALATLGTFTFLGNWQSFFWPLIVTSSEKMKTLPIGLSYFQDIYTTNWTLLMAASVIVLAPALLIFILNQRFITQGIALTGLKG
ncbi:MAG: sugar ABC transporter permease [Elusimicrobia bacterium RIFOXYA2_FULL_50_26]|nr:MAG: sugar ABC transporter permease [Elusimicrobia bacterium RIFOXYA2_FULL_50_26]OGS24245.1 MAG: sugar ABC transporter permease [Elusimicrobia bacterium RIFOXYB2_FULL_50_12]